VSSKQGSGSSFSRPPGDRRLDRLLQPTAPTLGAEDEDPDAAYAVTLTAWPELESVGYYSGLYPHGSSDVAILISRVPFRV